MFFSKLRRKKTPTLFEEGAFPPAFFEKPDCAAPGNECPVSLEEMAENLSQNHKALCVEEPETHFTGFKLSGTVFFRERHFWFWTCTDGFERNWDVVVGQGRTPFVDQVGDAVWMHAELNKQKIDHIEWLAMNYPEHEDELRKKVN